MNLQSPAEIATALQTAIGPVILISGIGLWLLTMTNRLGRAIDRARALSSSPSLASQEHRQIDILFKRAKLLRSSVLLAVLSALNAAGLVIFLFLSVIMGKALSLPIIVMFFLCISSLIISLVLFMWDVNLSLEALSTKLNR